MSSRHAVDGQIGRCDSGVRDTSLEPMDAQPKLVRGENDRQPLQSVFTDHNQPWAATVELATLFKEVMHDPTGSQEDEGARPRFTTENGPILAIPLRKRLPWDVSGDLKDITDNG